MSVKYFSVALALCTVMFWTTAAKADSVSEAKSAIQATYDARNAAVDKTNVYGVLDYYAPDFIYLSPDGKTMDKAQSQVALTTLFEQVVTIRMTTHVLGMTLKGTDALVRAKHWIVETLLPEDFVLIGEPIPKEMVSYVDTSSDTWTYTGSHWLLQSSHTLTRIQVVPGGPNDPHPTFRSVIESGRPQYFMRLLR
jgi:hypothetical protein